MTNNNMQQKLWERSFFLLITLLLIISSILPSVGGARVVKADDLKDESGPGGVKDGLISWVDIERSKVNDATTPENVNSLTDLADAGSWEPNDSSNTEVPNAMNFNAGIKITSNKGFYRRSMKDFKQDDEAREVFSVQKSTNYSGFPWELGGLGASGTSKYGNDDGGNIKTYFGRVYDDGNGIVTVPVDSYDLKNGSLMNTWSASNDWAFLLNGKKLKEETSNTPNFTTNSSSSNYYIGAGHGSRFNGTITETILFNRKLNDTERAQVNSYLALKNGLTLDSDYIASDGSTTIWTKSDDYASRITGIGRDDNGSLNQKQSKSEIMDSNVTIALGDSIEDTNLANENTFTNNKSFFVFADNGEDATFKTALTDEDEKGLKHLQRIYKVEKTANFVDSNLTFGIDKIGGAKEYPLYLIVSEDDKFTKSDLFYELTDGKVTINSDKLANDAYFTFAAPAPKLTGAELKQTQATSNKITLTFDKEVEFKGDAKNGFTVTVGGQDVTLDNDAFKVDPNDSTKVIVTLPTGTDVTDKEVKVSYDGEGNLTGKNGVPVNEFEKVAEDPFAAALTITKPDAQVTEPKPEITGEVEVGSEVTVVIKDKDGNAVTNAGGIASINENGNWTFIPSGDLEDGEYTVEVTATKGDKIATKTKDFTVSTKQTVDYEKVTDVTDISPTGVTYDETTGKFTAPLGVDKFTFKDGDKEMTAQKDANGDWKITEADSSVIVILTEPEANTVKTAQPTFKGTATPGSTVTVKVSDTLTLEATADANGNWSVTPDAALPDGDYNIEVTAEKDGVTSEKDTKKLTIATVDKAQLQARVDMSTGLTEGNYTPDSWTTYQDALDAAKNVLANPNVTQQQVDDAYNTLKNAQDALELTDSTAGVDKSKLQAKADASAQLTEGDYTPDSWKNYMNALNKAENVLNDPNATQAEVDQALEDLINAEKALEKKGGLNALTPSTGTLSPSFSNDVYNYSMNVGNGTTEMDFSYGLFDANANAKVTMTSNGVKVTDGKAPLKVGQNTIVIKVEDATGTKTYTITVNRANPSTGGGSGGGVTPPTGPTTETIIVDLEVDGDQPIEKSPVEITRTTNVDGTISDRVELTPQHAQQAVDKALEIGNNIARIVLLDTEDKVDRATVEVPIQAVKLLRENGIDLQIYSNDVLITLPETSMEGIEGDFYFRLVPVKEKSKQQEIEERAKIEEVVKKFMGQKDIQVVARPMTIETNLSSRPVLITLPLRDVKMPENALERAAFLKRLGVYIEHSDGEKEVVFGTVVEMPNGELGLQISVTKFSTFTILNFGEESGEHSPYIYGYPGNAFKPNKSITRNEVALMLARNLGYVDGKTTTPTAPFKDVPVDSQGAAAIALLKELGIVDGYNGNFRGKDPITRAEMSKMLADYMKLDIKDTLATFKDTANLWSTHYIEAIREAGIITGYNDGTFKPQNYLTRAEAVTMLNRVFDRGSLHGDIKLEFKDVTKNHWAYHEILEAATSHTYEKDVEGKEWVTK